MMTLKTGQLVKQRYQILELLGQSQSSQTYLALDVASATTCIIKQVKTGDLSLASRLRQLKDLQHPRLPRWLDAFEEEGYSCWVQEYIAGESLVERLKLGGFSVAELWQVLEQTLPILHYLHSRGVVHGDIRPENLIGRSGLDDLMLVDLAAIPTGSPEYAAPEQVQGHPVFASDLYSLGITGLSLLTGLRPMEFWNAAGSNDWRDYWRPEPRSNPERLAQLLDGLLDPNPSERFTASKAIAAVERIRGRKLRVQIALPPVRCLATFTKHQGIFASVNAVAAQGNLLASASDDKSIRLWTLPTGAACGELWVHQGAVKAVAFHPQDPILASGSQDRSIKLWDCQTQQVQTLTGHSSAVNTVAFSPDGQLASGSSDKTIKLWRSGECCTTLTGHRLAVNAVAFSNDGTKIASASADSTVMLWDITGKCLQILSGHTQAVRAVAFSSSGLIASGGDGSIRLWNLERNDCRLLSGHPWPVSALLFSSDGNYLISASWDKTLKIWRVETGEEIFTLHGHTDSINGIALAGELLVSGSKDKTVKIWQTSEIIPLGI